MRVSSRMTSLIFAAHLKLSSSLAIAGMWAVIFAQSLGLDVLSVNCARPLPIDGFQQIQKRFRILAHIPISISAVLTYRASKVVSFRPKSVDCAEVPAFNSVFLQ